MYTMKSPKEIMREGEGQWAIHCGIVKPAGDRVFALISSSVISIICKELETPITLGVNLTVEHLVMDEIRNSR